MKYTTFNQVNNNPLTEPMFFGNPVNVARYDQQKHPIFEKLIELFFAAKRIFKFSQGTLNTKIT